MTTLSTTPRALLRALYAAPDCSMQEHVARDRVAGPRAEVGTAVRTLLRRGWVERTDVDGGTFLLVTEDGALEMEDWLEMVARCQAASRDRREVSE